MSKFKTPKGRASFPSLDRTEKYQGQDTGYYKTKLLIPEGEAKELMAQAKEVAVEEYGPKKAGSAAMPFKKVDGGMVQFSFKTKNKPAIYDAQGQLVEDDLKIGSGTVMKIAGTFKPMTGKIGVNAYMNAVMIYDLKSYGGGNPFTDEDKEDGFTHKGGGNRHFDDEDEDDAPSGNDSDEDEEF